MHATEIRLDRYTRTILGVLAALLTIIAVELWHLAPPLAPAVHAQIPDTAFQRKQIVDEARRTNELLSDIFRQLRDGTVKVELAGPDKGDEAPNRGRRMR